MPGAPRCSGRCGSSRSSVLLWLGVLLQAKAFPVTKSLFYTILISRAGIPGLASRYARAEPDRRRCRLLLLGWRRRPNSAHRRGPVHAVLTVRHVVGALSICRGHADTGRRRVSISPSRSFNCNGSGRVGLPVESPAQESGYRVYVAAICRSSASPEKLRNSLNAVSCLSACPGSDCYGQLRNA